MNINQKIILFHHISIIIGILIYGFNPLWALLVFLLSMFWAMIVGGQVMHFYFSHKTYQDNLKSYFYTFLTLCTGLGSPISFSASHRQHHQFVDTEQDPHSPKHIGWFRVYFLDWQQQNISPRIIRDYSKSKFQKTAHKHWFTVHAIIGLLLFIIHPVLLFFILSPFVVYTFHAASIVNVLGHLHGEPRNCGEIRWLNLWAWNHGDHHFHKE